MAAAQDSGGRAAAAAAFDVSPTSMFHQLAYRLYNAHASSALHQLQLFFSPAQSPSDGAGRPVEGRSGTPAWKDPMYVVALK